MYMYMHISFAYFCALTPVIMYWFPKNMIVFGVFQEMWFSKKLGGFENFGVSRDFQGKQGKYPQVPRASDLTDWHVCSGVW